MSARTFPISWILKGSGGRRLGKRRPATYSPPSAWTRSKPFTTMRMTSRVGRTAASPVNRKALRFQAGRGLCMAGGRGVEWGGGGEGGKRGVRVFLGEKNHLEGRGGGGGQYGPRHSLPRRC